MLPDSFSRNLKSWQESIPGGHLVSLTLKDGRQFENVFIQNCDEIIGIYNENNLPFEAADIADIQPTNLSTTPHFFSNPLASIRRD